MAIATLRTVAVYVILHFFVLEISALEAKNVQVSFELNASTTDRVVFDADAHFVFDEDAQFVLQLTNSSRGFDVQGSAGRAAYNETIPLWDASTKEVANFTTHFQFQINWPNISTRDLGGDGLAFFMAPIESGYKVAFRGKGGYLGLLNAENNGKSSNKLLAVEFDTFNTPEWDADGNHVGIDVNNMKSIATCPLGERLSGGEIWDARIDYRGRENVLKVFVSCRCNGEGPWNLSHGIDLTQYLPEDIVVGFSAATSTSSEIHRVISWNFTSTISRSFKGGGKREFSWKVAIAIGFAGLVTANLISFIIYYKIRSRPKSDSMEADIDLVLDHVPRKFKYGELSEGTNNFSEAYKLGQGGSGDVYKGILVKTDEIVAVKRISAESKQGKKEYLSEIGTITRLRHRNLVQLLGWCHEKTRLLLVYEYMPNGSLNKFLFEERRGELDWRRRYKIASDIASALLYLHELWDECVVHRDVKSSNVMLDSEFNAKLGDFGLARLVKHNQYSQTSTVAGTFGYLAPECASGVSSAESDVFSFGAVALEIACGRRAIDPSLGTSTIRLVEWVWDLYGQGRLFDAVDSSLNGEFDTEEMEMLIVIGLWCSYPDPLTRPTMRQVIQLLNFEGQLPRLPPTLPVAGGGFCSDTASTSDFRPPAGANSQEMREFTSSAASSSTLVSAR